MVQGVYGKGTSRIFKSLQRNTSALPPDAVETLTAAVHLSAAQESANRNNNSGPRPNNRGGYRGRGRYFNNNRDVFSNMHRQVPRQPPPHFDE